MKIIIIIFAVLAAIIAALCFVRVSLRVRYIDSLEVNVSVAGIDLNKLLKLFKFKKSGKRAKKDNNREENPDKKEKRPLIDSLGDILSIVNKFVSRFFGHVKVRVAHIVIIVGGRDPAKTAVTYGGVIQAVAYITELLKAKTSFGTTKDACVDIRPDFTLEKTLAQIDIKLSVSVGGVLHSLIYAAWAHLTK